MKTIKILFLLTGLSISTMGFGAQLGNTSGRTPKEDERFFDLTFARVITPEQRAKEDELRANPKPIIEAINFSAIQGNAMDLLNALDKAQLLNIKIPFDDCCFRGMTNSYRLSLDNKYNKKKVEIYQRNAKYFLKVLNSLVKAIEPNWVDVQ